MREILIFADDGLITLYIKYIYIKTVKAGNYFTDKRKKTDNPNLRVENLS